MNPVTGQHVGPYEILGRLGSGGMGLVFSAWDGRLHRDVAIKFLREEYVSRDSRERFLMEARAASGLNHPNICTVFDIGEQDGNPYLVMELLKGETLRARISAGPISPEEILRFGTDVADALAAAHARGIIHRDIKPANIFLVTKPTGGSQAKVLDFGLAKIDLGDGAELRFEMTGVGATVGTVSYMSPEQARGELLDSRSDLFALGIVLYEMATGSVPFQGVTSALVYVQLLSHPPEGIRKINPAISKEMERIILKLLAKDCGERFQSAAELLNALHKVSPKKTPALGGLFSKPSLSWGRNSSGQSTSSKKGSAAQEVSQGQSPRVSSASRKSSEVAAILRPVRRDPVPPDEFSSNGGYWSSSRGEATAVEESTSRRSSLKARWILAAEDGPVSSSSASARRSANFSYEAPEEEAAIVRERVKAGHPRWLPWTILGGIFLIAGAAIWKLQTKPEVMKGPAKLMLASMANHSGDKTLDGVILEGLRLDLSQSPHLVLTESPASAAGLPVSEPATLIEARSAATAAGATTFLFGEVTKGAGPYVVNVGIYGVASGASIAQAEETAGSREQLGDAIDRLSAQIRIGLGESSETFGRTSVPLARDATSNVEALASYVAGAEAQASGRPLEAMVAFQKAVAIEPKFTQGWIRLAAIYREQYAEIAAGNAAVQARDASVGTSERTKLLAELSYALNVTANHSRAFAVLDQLEKNYPLDLSIGAERARLLRREGRFAEAIVVAQGALAKNGYDRKASAQAEYAMLALDRGEAAFEIESQAERHGQRHPELRVLLPFLNNTRGSAPVLVQDVEPDELPAQANRAQVMDATGQLTAGLYAWQGIVGTAKTYPALASTAAYVLAQAALDRAFTADCSGAATLVHEAESLPRGQNAIFAIGMAQGLCGNLNGARDAVDMLTVHYPQSSAVMNYYLANLLAVDQIRSGDSDAALSTLQAARQYDLISLTPYLRGLAHVEAKDWQAAIADFQFMLLHRGAVTLVNAPVYAMAQIGLARAYAASGDKANSKSAYAAFLAMWQADPKDRLVVEARQHLK